MNGKNKDAGNAKSSANNSRGSNARVCAGGKGDFGIMNGINLFISLSDAVTKNPQGMKFACFAVGCTGVCMAVVGYSSIIAIDHFILASEMEKLH